MSRGRSLASGAVMLVLAALIAFVAFHDLGDRSASGGPTRAAGAAVDAGQAMRRADPGRGSALFATCAACHPIERDAVDRDGPNLYGVVGSRIAKRRGRYGYTAALRRVGGTWTDDRLDAWLENPAAFAPGTTMTFAGLPDPQDRADVIAYLTEMGSKPPLR